MIAAVAIIISLLACRRLPAADPPNADLPAVNVTATLPGASPEIVATSVATPLERVVSKIAGVRSITSSSRMGETSITIQFEPGRDLDRAASEVLEAIQKILPQLPAGMTPPLFRKGNPADPLVLYLALTSETLPLSEVSEFAESRMAQRISMVSYVGEVRVYGASRRATLIQLDPDKLAAYAIGVDQVEAALKTETRPTELITVAFRNGSPVRLGDIAKIVSSVENAKTASWYNDRRAVILAVQKVPGGKAAEMVAEIRKQLPGFQKEKPAVKVDVIENGPNSIVGSTEFVSGASLRQKIEAQRKVAVIVTKDPNVESSISILGGQLYLNLKKEHHQSVDEIIPQLRKNLGALPGLKVHLWNPKTGRRTETITGPDFSEVVERAQRMLDKLRATPGVEDVATDLQFADPYLTLHIDQDKAQSAGVKAEQVEAAFSIAHGDHPVLRLPQEGFSKLFIAGKDGRLVRLDSLAALGMTTGPLAVNHTNLLPSVTFSIIKNQ
jgi:multidrug efflux pump subunit AcrB